MPSTPVGGAWGTPRSALSGIPWPAVPGRWGAVLLALQDELAATQWLPPDELRRLQFNVLDPLVRHACSSVVYYRDRPEYAAALAAPLGPEAWAELPILGREEVQAAGTALTSPLPREHLPVSRMTTSGSTGRPLTVLATQITGLFWVAGTLRDHLWHGRDASLTFATLRPDRTGEVPPEGIVLPDWGAPISLVYDTGPLAAMPVQQDVAVQADWLAVQDPAYLLSLPSNLLALCRNFAATGRKLPRLREVLSYGEVLGPELRQACRDVWGVPVTDRYSSHELGYLALQCPTSERYHVMSEIALVEVIDDDGRACLPGETGRVVVTQLHNYAQPLIRYELGDYAEVGEPCPCGRGLPVLNRVVGRRRNMLVLPTGETFWPTFGSAWTGLGDVVHQFQLVQQELDLIHVRIAGPRPLTTEEQARVAAELVRRFGYPFRVTFEFLSVIERTAGSKFEDFVSQISLPLP